MAAKRRPIFSWHTRKVAVDVVLFAIFVAAVAVALVWIVYSAGVR